tara:strand:+ start:467 stop:673 length:207 start_codon:yes stop_codon:yes gene_type:complete
MQTIVNLLIAAIEKTMLPLLVYLKGYNDAELKRAKEDKEALKEAVITRHKLATDNDFRKRVRNKFTKR